MNTENFEGFFEDMVQPMPDGKEPCAYKSWLPEFDMEETLETIVRFASTSWLDSIVFSSTTGHIGMSWKGIIPSDRLVAASL